MLCHPINAPNMVESLSNGESHTDLLQLAATNRDKVLVLLSSIEAPCKIRDLKAIAIGMGFRRARSLNISDVLARATPYAVNLRDGWQITSLGRRYLAERGLLSANTGHPVDPPNLRNSLMQVANDRTVGFLDEAIKCHENRLHRAAVIMSWIGAIALVQQHVVEVHLDEFNEIANRKNKGWKSAKTANELGQMRESEFLNRLSEISVIGNDVKKELMQCLNRRNSCSHPNDFVVGEQTSAYHLEVLINNVFTRVCALSDDGNTLPGDDPSRPDQPTKKSSSQGSCAYRSHCGPSTSDRKS